MSTPEKRSDGKLFVWLLGGVVLLIVGIALFTPRTTEEDPKPTTTNTGSQGAKAAFLTLQALGRTAVRWDEDSSHIPQLDAPRSTLVLANPEVAPTERKELADRLHTFLERGGRVLVTGSGWRAGLLPGGREDPAPELAPTFCETAPEGPGPLAAAGSVEMAFGGSWNAAGPQFRVEQRCGGNGVVVQVPVGAGEAVWWGSATPLTNAGLKRDGDLRLLLASLGDARDVYFDEYYYGQHAAPAGGTDDRQPWALFWQSCLLCVLILWSFSRRKGPLRMPVIVPRSSPVEFAESMGGLYGKARATEPVIEAAERRLERLLMSEAGLSREVARGAPQGVAETLTARFGGNWSELRQHLEQAQAARGEAMSPGDALRLVQHMAEDEARLRAMLTRGADAARAEHAEEALAVGANGR